MAAHLKLKGSRERRLLRLIENGEPVAAACRAVEVSRQTVYRHARTDPMFAERLAVARARPAPVEEDWRVIAERLEREYPRHWAPVSLPDAWELE
jgi:Helix-turn-helix domain of resolvase